MNSNSTLHVFGAIYFEHAIPFLQTKMEATSGFLRPLRTRHAETPHSLASIAGEPL